ncbi:mucin-2-like [Amphibalanus amphitrite]|uniref:mucin-2-like n=1 Tax=Amphibalanus amphitrite TaxID=1232801 RepID=UPI001C908C79|nr:mucin-2-like [Amphibalanus amphitrite]
MSVVKFRCSATAVSWDGKRTEAGPHLDCCQSRARPGTGVPPHNREQSPPKEQSRPNTHHNLSPVPLAFTEAPSPPAMGSSHQRLWRRPRQLALPLNLLLLLLLLPTRATPLPAATRSSSLLERTNEDGVLAKDTAGGLREERLMELLTQAVKEGIRHKIERLCNISEKVSFSGSDDSPSSNVLVRTKNNFIKELCPDIGDRCRKYPRPPPDVRVVAPASHWAVGDVARYECLPGYLFSTGVTEVTSTCQTDGWSQLIFPSCVRDPCLATNGTCAGGTCSHVCTAGICSASCVCPEGTVLFEGQCVSDPCHGMPCGGPEVTLGVTVERDPDSGQPWCRCHCRPAALNINNRCLDCWSPAGGRPPLCPCDSDSDCDRRVTLSGTGRPVRAGFCLRGACFDCGQFPADSPELPLGCLVQSSVIAPPANSPQQPPIPFLPAPQESNVLFHVPMAPVVPAMPIKETPDRNTLLTTSTHSDTATDSSIHPNKENSTGSPGPTSEPQIQTVPEGPTPEGQEPEAEKSETTSVPDVTTETPSTPAKDGSASQAAQPTTEAPSATTGYQQPTAATLVESTTAALAKSTTTTAHEPATEASDTTTGASVTTTGYQQPTTSTPVESTTAAAPEQTTAEEYPTTVESATAVTLEESTTALVPEEFTTEAAPVQPTTKAAPPVEATTTAVPESATVAPESTTEALGVTFDYQQPTTAVPDDSTTMPAPEDSTTTAAVSEESTTAAPVESTTGATEESTTVATEPATETPETASEVPEPTTEAPEPTKETPVTTGHQQLTTTVTPEESTITAAPVESTTMAASEPTTTEEPSTIVTTEESTTMVAAPVETPSTEVAPPVESATTAEPAPATETLEPTPETPMTTMGYQQPTTATTKEPTTKVTSVESTTTAASESTEAPKPASDAPEPTTEAPVTIYYHQSTATTHVESTTTSAPQSTEAPEPATKAPEPTSDAPVTTAGYQQPTTVTTKKPTTTVAPVESTTTAGPTVESSTKAVTEESTATIAPEPTTEAPGQTSDYQQPTTKAPEGAAATVMPVESTTTPPTEPATGVPKPTAETLETTGYQQPTATTSAAPTIAVTPEESTTTLEESAATLEEFAKTAVAVEESTTTAPVLSPADSPQTSPALGSATVATDEGQRGSSSTTNSSRSRPTDVQTAISPENLKPVNSTTVIRPPKVPLKTHPVISPASVQTVSSNKPVQPESDPVKTPPISTAGEVSPDFPEENRLELDVLPPSTSAYARPSAIASDVEEVKATAVVRPAPPASGAQPANNARPDATSVRPTNATAGVILVDRTTNERPTITVIGVKPASTTANARPPFVFIHARTENAAAKIPSFPASVEVNSTKDAKIRSNTTDPSAEIDLLKSGETSKVEPLATTEVKTPSAPYQAATVGTNTTHTLPITPSTHSSSVNTSHYQPPVKPASKVPTDIHSPSQPHSTDKSQQSVPVSKVQPTKPDTSQSRFW